MRPIFESLVFGPVDWTSGAAILALGRRAQRDPDSAAAIRELLVVTVDDLLPHGCEPRIAPLVETLTTLPCIPPTTIEKLRQFWTTYVDSPQAPPVGSDAGTPPSPPRDTDARPATSQQQSPPSARTGIPRWIYLVLAGAIALNLLRQITTC